MTKSVSKRIDIIVIIAILFIGISSSKSLSAQAVKVKGDWRSLILAVIREDPLLAYADDRYSASVADQVTEYFNLFPNILLRGSAGSVASVSSAPESVFQKPSKTFPKSPRYTNDFINSIGYSATARFDVIDKSFQILRIVRAGKRGVIARQQYNRALTNTIKRGLYAYSGLYYANKKARLLNNRVRILQEKLKYINRAVQLKQRTLFDQWNAELNVQFSQESLLIAQKELMQSLAFFKRVFQRDISANSLTSLSLPVVGIPASSDESRLLVSLYNPLMIISKVRSDLAGTDFGLQIQDTLPSVAVVGSYSDDQNSSALSPGKSVSYSLKLEVGLDIGLFPAAVSRVISQKYQRLADSRNSIEQQRDILYNFNQTWQSYQGTKKQVALLQAVVANNEKIVRGQRRLRKRGAVSILSVMEIESGFSLILERQLNAQREHQIDTINLMSLLNLLTPRSLKLSK